MPLDLDAIRFVYFDLDDTLLDHRRAERDALAELCRTHASLGLHDPAHVADTYHRHNKPLWQAYAAGEIGRDDVQRLRFERLCEALALDDIDPHGLGERYMDAYAASWQLIDEAWHAYATIAGRWPVGILTNGFAEYQRAKLARFPALAERAQAIVISEDVGVLKPDPRLFAYAAQAVDVEPEAILYVGDSYTSDVVGAHGAGWQIAWYTDDEAPREPDGHRFARWSDLLDALRLDVGAEPTR